MNILKRINSLIKTLSFIDKTSADKVYNLTKNDNIFEELYKDDVDEELDEHGADKDLEDEYLKTLLPEYSDNKRKDIEKDTDLPQTTIRYILDTLNFHIVQKEPGDYLGMGAEGIVFSGIYQGKDAVIKIQYDESTSHGSEIQNWRNMLTLKRKLPAELKQYIPEIMFLDKVKSGSHDFPVIIMERLYPIDPNNYNMGDYMEVGNRDQILKNLKIPELLYEFAKLVSDFLNLDRFKSIDKENITPIEIFNYSNEHYSDIVKSMIHSEDKFVKNLLEHFMPQINNPDNKVSLSIIIQKINYFMFKLFAKTYSPHNEDGQLEHFEKNDLRVPGHRSFRKFIKTLKSYGIIIEDMHYRNVMENKDHVPKIIDISLFYVPKAFNDEDDSYL